MAKTKEFYDIMAQFEKDGAKLFYGKRMDREDKSEWNRQNYYQDGFVNLMFRSFLLGYQLHKSISN